MYRMSLGSCSKHTETAPRASSHCQETASSASAIRQAPSLQVTAHAVLAVVLPASRQPPTRRQTEPAPARRAMQPTKLPLPTPRAPQAPVFLHLGCRRLLRYAVPGMAQKRPNVVEVPFSHASLDSVLLLTPPASNAAPHCSRTARPSTSRLRNMPRLADPTPVQSPIHPVVL